MSSASVAQPAWLRIPLIAVVAVVAIYVVDVLFDINGGLRGVLRVAVVVAAVVVAGTLYQRWSTVPTRSVPHHVMAALALVGGAFVASSAFDAGAGVFGNGTTGALGLAALVIAMIAAHLSLTDASGAGR